MNRPRETIIDIRFTTSAVFVVLPVALITVAIVLVRATRRRTDRSQTLWNLALVAYLSALVSVTLFPLQVVLGQYAGEVTFDSLNLVPFITIDAKTFVLNILVFIPFGFLLPLTSNQRSPWKVTAWGAVLSLAIELIQLASSVLLGSGRTTDVNDLIANTTGTLLGYGLIHLASTSPKVRRLLPGHVSTSAHVG